MEPKERLARQNEVATTLDNIDALDTDQLRAVLRGFVVDDVAFEPEQLTMLSIVLSETRHKTGATKVGSYDAMALFGRRETALSQSRINWSAKQEARYEAAKKVQSEMDSTDPPELTKDQWVQIQRELRGEVSPELPARTLALNALFLADLGENRLWMDLEDKRLQMLLPTPGTSTWDSEQHRPTRTPYLTVRTLEATPHAPRAQRPPSAYDRLPL